MITVLKILPIEDNPGDLRLLQIFPLIFKYLYSQSTAA